MFVTVSSTKICQFKIFQSLFPYIFLMEIRYDLLINTITNILSEGIYIISFKKLNKALAGVAHLVGALSYKLKGLGSIAGWGTGPGCRFGPRSRRV